MTERTPEKIKSQPSFDARLRLTLDILRALGRFLDATCQEIEIDFKWGVGSAPKGEMKTEHPRKENDDADTA